MGAPGFSAERAVVMPAALRARRALGFACEGLACTCSGDADCNDMFTTGLCGDIAVCYTQPGGGVVCACLRL